MAAELKGWESTWSWARRTGWTGQVRTQLFLLPAPLPAPFQGHMGQESLDAEHRPGEGFEVAPHEASRSAAGGGGSASKGTPAGCVESPAGPLPAHPSRHPSLEMTTHVLAVDASSTSGHQSLLCFGDTEGLSLQLQASTNANLQSRVCRLKHQLRPACSTLCLSPREQLEEAALTKAPGDANAASACSSARGRRGETGNPMQPWGRGLFCRATVLQSSGQEGGIFI